MEAHEEMILTEGMFSKLKDLEEITQKRILTWLDSKLYEYNRGKLQKYLEGRKEKNPSLEESKGARG